MKKVLRIVIFIFVFFAGMNMVMAQGPKNDGYIKVIDATQNSETTTYLYSKTETIKTLNGISYDEQSNILTLNNYNAKLLFIKIHNMGDLKINVIGSNIINNYIHNYDAASIEVTGNNSTTIYGGGSISFSGYIGIESDTGILNIDNVSLSNKIDGNGNLIISEGKVNIENSTLSFDFFGRSYSNGIIAYDDLTIKNSNISGNAGSGIGSYTNATITNSTIDVTVSHYMEGVAAANNLNIENSTIKTKDGSIFGEGTTNISNSNIDIKHEEGYQQTAGLGGLNLNIKDSNLNIDTAASSCIMGKDIIINGGTMKLKSANIGIRISYFYDHDNPTSSLIIKKGGIDITTAFKGIGFDDHYDEGSIANFTMENGKVVIKSPMGVYVSNAYFNGGYIEMDASNKDGEFADLGWFNGTVFAMESINIASNVEISDNLKVYKLDYGDGTYIYYLNDEEIKLNEQNPDSKPLLKNVIIKDKNYKEEEITSPKEEITTKKEEKNNIIENPKTADIAINIVLPLLLVVMFFVLIGIQKLKKINHK